jgi:DUF4097 and DUF4098 domain-containing protein YvlB
VTRSFDTPGDVTVRVSVSSPDIEITTWNQATTQVELVPRRNDKATMEALETTTVACRPTSDGFEVVVEQQRRNLSFGRGPSLVVRVRCPEGTAVEVHGSSADVVCRGTLRSLRSRTASGDVTAEAVTGHVSADAASGDIKVASCGSISAKLASGDVDAGTVSGAAEVTTVSGDITIRSWSGKTARLQAVSGDVTLRLVPGRRVHFDVSSISGSTRSSLDPMGDQRAAFPDGAGDDSTIADIWIRTVSGDVSIERAEMSRRAG